MCVGMCVCYACVSVCMCEGVCMCVRGGDGCVSVCVLTYATVYHVRP